MVLDEVGQRSISFDQWVLHEASLKEPGGDR